MAFRCWVSFDLGLRGEYDTVYQWLDELNAKECGDSVATFVTDKTVDEISDEVSHMVGDEKVRIYVIGRKADDSLTGRFAVGHRKQAPWSGYAHREGEVDEEQ